MGPGMFDGLEKAIRGLIVLAVIGLVLLPIELLRLAWWIWNHVSIK
jgi:hypothetical protein